MWSTRNGYWFLVPKARARRTRHTHEKLVQSFRLVQRSRYTDTMHELTSALALGWIWDNGMNENKWNDTTARSGTKVAVPFLSEWKGNLHNLSVFGTLFDRSSWGYLYGQPFEDDWAEFKWLSSYRKHGGLGKYGNGINNDTSSGLFSPALRQSKGAMWLDRVVLFTVLIHLTLYLCLRPSVVHLDSLNI